MLRRRQRVQQRGQSIIEYLLVAAAIIAAVAVFSGKFTTAYTQVGDDVKEGLTDASGRLKTLASP